MPLFAAIPGILFDWWLITNYPGNVWTWVVGLILAGAMFVSSLCILVAGCKRLILPDVKPGGYPLQSIFFVRKWTVDKLVELSLMLNNAQYGTLYIASSAYARAKIGVRGEISTVSNITPELLTIKDEAFVADMASIGPARVYRETLDGRAHYHRRPYFHWQRCTDASRRKYSRRSLIGRQSTPPRSDDLPR